MENIVVSVGMGPGQTEFIRRLKKYGYRVAAFGKGNNSDEAIELADYTEYIDTKDVEGAIKWLDSLGKKIIAIGSYAGGQAVTTVQMLSNYYGVSTKVPNELIVGSDKIMQQKMYQKFDLSRISTWKFSEISEECVMREELSSFIMKPVIGRGSEGIIFLSKEEVLNKIKKQEYSAGDILQGVVDGDEYRCLVIVQDGELKLLAPIHRISYKETVFLGVLQFSDKHLNELECFFGELVKKTGINNSIIKVDVIVSEKSIDVIEMDIGVGGGSYFKKYISCLYDCDIMDVYIKLITNQRIPQISVKYPNLRMDYVYNNKRVQIEYDVNECIQKLEEKYGKVVLQINVLHPERKSSYDSNADFVFCVIHHEKDNDKAFYIDDFCNNNLLKKI